ncbi:MAG: YjjG family noncanonical pyrimidine nucleotidase [Clostridia bacterium]|nr:YjjG family noncanonical pyrimidine nucleotidase [Clostridia bacterium]
MRYQYLLVDNDNTLMDFNEAERKALLDTLKEAGLTTDEATCTAYHHINDALWKALERGETTQPLLKVERFRQLLAHLERPDIEPETLSAAYAANLGSHADLLPGALEFIDALHGRIKIALVSNGVSTIQRGRLARCPFTDKLDAVVISEEVGVSKPNPRMVEVALEQLGCTDKTQAVLMGDSLTADIPAAVNAGIDSIYFSLHGKTSDQATYTASGYEEVIRLLLGDEA